MCLIATFSPVCLLRAACAAPPGEPVRVGVRACVEGVWVQRGGSYDDGAVGSLADDVGDLVLGLAGRLPPEELGARHALHPARLARSLACVCAFVVVCPWAQRRVA